MKKFVSILAIAFVSLNFVSCRQDDVTSDMEVTSAKENLSLRKTEDTAKTDTVKATLATRPVDPDPPVKDTTNW
ncbi:hypothetical protein [Epilithonimonas arachidiradicis]|uniref:Uncharacterized protein n=1 Tax=Epilithonimonas arachidiradicis TaxID=1617282 RepID=A0A420D8D8_9FLAO|nr:hypothetical protein [Epilithonimonas arachidiradicis]RKE86777.1 hypothetical protein BXY58_2604 [Epilithonimonas arachidiradicis]GGG62067.1 hypothetical protein GCM10007332_25070 [Epilithonimonas arachidiradicis]